MTAGIIYPPGHIDTYFSQNKVFEIEKPLVIIFKRLLQKIMILENKDKLV